MKPIEVEIRTGTPYVVTIGEGLLDESGTIASRVLKAKRLMVVTDTNVAPLYLDQTVASLKQAGFEVEHFIFEAGEQSKTLQTLGALLEKLAETRMTRTDAIVALGGGVTGDLAGFAAGVYARGIDFIQIPTTLLAAVDSSVGGKTAVDLKAGKNLAGVFLQPKAVICDTKTLATLPPETFADGLAEAIKYGILCDAALFEAFKACVTPENIAPIIARCVQIKADYVTQDTFDHGVRAYLNLGHTFAHAIEKLSVFQVTHGSAVAIGMVLIAKAGEAMGITQTGTAAAIESLLKTKGLPVTTVFNANDLAREAAGDKKRSGDDITLILIDRIGSTFLKKIPVTDLIKYATAAKDAS